MAGRGWIDWRDKVAPIAGANGIIIESNSGAWLRSTAMDGVCRIYRSIDAGKTWVVVCTMTVAWLGGLTKGAFVDSRGHIYMGGGSTKCFWSTYNTPDSGGRFCRAELWKSSDDGLTWRKACTGEAGTFWKIAEDIDGRIYTNEYSQLDTGGAGGPTWPADYGNIPDEYPAVNVWRSDTAGEVFSKWFSAPKPSGQGQRDGTRHIHAVYVDPTDAAKRVYLAAGDFSADVNLQWAGLAGHVVQIDQAGSQVFDYGGPTRFGNGCTSFTGGGPNGSVIVGKDNNPSGIDLVNPLVAVSCQQCDMRAQFGTRFDGYVFDLFRSAEGVIFGNVTLGTRYPSILYSTDNGVNWGALNYGTAQGNTLTHNPNGPGGLMFMSGGSVLAIKVPSRVELGWKRPYHFPKA